MAVVAAPVALLLSPKALAVEPFATEAEPAAVAKLPVAVLLTPTTVTAKPFATLAPPVAVKARLEALRERFGFTPAEATFALEIVKGDGRQATADRLGITVGTARSHLSRIFDKTGVTRQAELVRLLLQK